MHSRWVAFPIIALALLGVTPLPAQHDSAPRLNRNDFKAPATNPVKLGNLGLRASSLATDGRPALAKEFRSGLAEKLAIARLTSARMPQISSKDFESKAKVRTLPLAVSGLSWQSLSTEAGRPAGLRNLFKADSSIK